MRMQAGEQCGPCRAATAAVVELPETNTTRGKSIQVRRVDLATMVAEIGKAHVIHQDQDNVRPFRRVDCGDG